MDLLEEGNEVVLAESMEFVRTISTTSRPASGRSEAALGRPTPNQPDGNERFRQ
jgi:hypothetical protein